MCSTSTLPVCRKLKCEVYHPGAHAVTAAHAAARRQRQKRERRPMPAAAAGDRLPRHPGLGASKPMPEAEIVKAVQLLDLMLAFFADDGHWTRGRYDDGNGGHCLV